MSNPLARLGLPDRELDELAAMLGLLLAVVLLPLQLSSSELYIVVLPPLVGLACLGYLFARRRRDLPMVGVGTVSASVGRVAVGLTLLGIGAMVTVAALAGGRSVTFFGLGAVVGALLLGQIFFVEEDGLRTGVLVAEILLFGLAIRLTALATTPGLVGVDSWTHVTNYAAAVRSADSLAAIEGVKYSAAPLYHAFVVVFSDALGTSLRMGLYLSLGLVMGLVGLFVYATGRHLLPVRWALFALFVFTVSDHVVRWGIHIIPTSLGLLFFLGVLYCLTRLFYADVRRPIHLVAVLLILATVLTHQVSAFILLAVTGAGLVGQGLSRYVTTDDARGWFDGNARTVNVLGFFVFEAVLVAATWSRTPYGGSNFLTEVTDNLRRTVATELGLLNLASDGSAAAAGGAGVPFGIELVDSLGFFILLFLSVVGMLAVLHRRTLGQPALTFASITGLLLVVTLGLPALGIRAFVPGRWYAFMYAPMAIVAAAGVFFAVRRIPAKAAVPALVVVALLLPGAMLVAHKGTPDAPAFEDEYTRFAYTEAELSAVETVGETHPAEEEIATDHPYRTVFDRSGASASRIYGIPGDEADGTSTTAESATVYRRYQSSGAPVFLANGTAVRQTLSTKQVCPTSRDRVYANEDVLVCTGS